MSRRKKQYPEPFHSKYEYIISLNLDSRNIPYAYEPTSFEYFLKTYQAKCEDCGSDNVFKKHWYTPDWYIESSDIYVESKGRFLAKDRKIQKAMKDYHPEIEIKVLLQYDNWLTKGKKQRYSDWCDKNGVDWHVSTTGVIPDRWI